MAKAPQQVGEQRCRLWSLHTPLSPLFPPGHLSSVGGSSYSSLKPAVMLRGSLCQARPQSQPPCRQGRGAQMEVIVTTASILPSSLPFSVPLLPPSPFRPLLWTNLRAKRMLMGPLRASHVLSETSGLMFSKSLPHLLPWILSIVLPKQNPDHFHESPNIQVKGF